MLNNVVLIYDGMQHNYLLSLSSQTHEELQIIAVDNGSTDEPFERVLIEARACLVSPLFSAVNGVLEVVEDEISGDLVAADDIEAYAVCICTLAGDDNLRKRMKNAARQRVQVNFSLETGRAHLKDLLCQASNNGEER